MRPLLLLLASAAVASAADPRADYFENKVRPLLVAKCYSCHSEQAKKSKGGLTLDTLAGLQSGGDSGPSVVPKKPDESRLVEAVRYTNANLQMPPKEKLTDAEIAVLVKWVADGAVWPSADTGAAKRKPGTITNEDRQWWAFRPLAAVRVPANREATPSAHPIDAFVAAKLADAKLSPSPEAEKRVLIRRLTYDLHGLPPTPTEIDEFVNDTSPVAYEKLVDRLLASPRYGERQARFWLDLVRYADSDGYRIDDYRPTAWRYRDYVINSFNADKPYSRFTQEQLAGDELFPDDPDARVATGYLRHWIYEYNNRDAKGHWANILNDITDTTADVFLGLGLQCARCHDHKFDPLLQKDYFRLQAFFAGLRPREDVPTVGAKEVAEYEVRQAAWEAKTAAVRQQIAEIESPARKKARDGAIAKFPEDIQEIMRKADGRRSPYEQQIHELAYRQVDYEFAKIETYIKDPAAKEKYLALRKELAKFDADKPPPLPTAPTCTDVGRTAPPITIPKRGDAAVEAGFPTILDPKPTTVTPLPNSTGRRSALANWLVEPTNPLTARVFVNRIWQQHFGRGLAANASDFGKLGDQPTHPELLDWLAARFMADGWSVKKLHRLMVTSAAYRQSAAHPEPAAGKRTDPENKLLWTAPVRRLDAEQIRDAMLAATGELDLKTFGPGSASSDPRRTIYTKIMRNSRDPLLDVFDAPYWFSSAASRDTTTTPVQSLFLFNSSGMLARGRAFAARLERDEPDEAKRVNRAYRLAFGRDATTEEVARVLRFVDEQAKTIDPRKAVAPAATFAAGKLPYRDGQAALLAMTGGFEAPGDKVPTGDFSVEAFASPKSVADTAAVRTIAAHWDGNAKTGGWNFGVTGKQSRRKPQTVVLQLFGTKRDGTFGEEAVFSDHQLTMNKPYYLAAAVKLATKEKPGEVTFFLKDLSNDDEPLLTAKVPHSITGGFDNKLPLTLGRRAGTTPAGFDGLLDDVRLSSAALGVGELLFTREGTNKHTVGYWQFEAKPGVMKDTAGTLELKMATTAAPPVTPRTARQTAWADFCHVLLNSSEFLYVE